MRRLAFFLGCLAFALAGAAPALAAPAVEVVFEAPWGSGPGELGRELPAEGNPECPMSFAVDARGGVFVLDQGNQRVAVFEAGRLRTTLPLGSRAFQDIELDGQGGLLLLDRLVDRAVHFIDGQGHPTARVPLAGATERLTGLFREPAGVRVEAEHQQQILIASASGVPTSESSARAGRLSQDGRWLVEATRSGPSTVQVSVTPAAGGAARRFPVTFPLPVFRVDDLEADGRGQLFLAVDLLREQPEPPFAVLEERAVVVVLSTGGAERARAEWPPLAGPEEQFRPVRLGADGALYQLRCEPQGAVLRRLSP